MLVKVARDDYAYDLYFVGFCCILPYNFTHIRQDYFNGTEAASEAITAL